MSRCNCPGWCEKCHAGPCDCTCPDEPNVPAPAEPPHAPVVVSDEGDMKEWGLS